MQPSSEQVVPKRSNTENFIWTDTEVQLLLSIVQEYKTQKTNDGVYWDSCKNKYTEINDMLVEKLVFMEGIPNDEYPHESATFLQNPTRLARKIKQLRNKYAAAVRVGKRSGGGRQVYTFYEQCQDVFGGNAAADEIPGGIETNHDTSGTVSCTITGEENTRMVGNLEQTATSQCDGGSLSDENTVEQAQPAKRRHLISSLRDQKLKKKIGNDQQMIQIAQKELVLQEQMIKKMGECDNQQANAIKTLSESITSIGQSLSEGFKSIAGVMALQNQVPHQYPAVSSRRYVPPYQPNPTFHASTAFGLHKNDPPSGQ